jgi:TDG/mug DNA glycosylase family protein
MALTSFPPVVDDHTRVLVLGSMPGTVSLRSQQYYAHPQNAFWRITGELVGFDPAADYRARVGALLKGGIGLWDVLHTCQREGSLDSAIAPDTMTANDFDGLFAAHPHITRVFFNGAKAEQIFTKVVYPLVAQRYPIEYRRLPSSSPANAAIHFDAKLQAWQSIVD